MKLLITTSKHYKSSLPESGPFASMDNSSSYEDEHNHRHDIISTKVTGRPLKKAKYAWQVKGTGRNGISAANVTHRTVTKAPVTDSNANNVTAATAVAEVTATTPLCSEAFDGTSSSSDSSITVCTNCNVDRLKAVAIEDALAAHPAPAAPLGDGVGDGGGSLANDVAGQSQPEVGQRGSESRPSFSLRKWQSKQMAQGIIDNAINNVLGDMGITPLRPESYGLAFGSPSNWSSYLNAQNIENEGVAEAIRQQGLQRRRGTTEMYEETGPSGSADASLIDAPVSNENLSSGLNCSCAHHHNHANDPATVSSHQPVSGAAKSDRKMVLPPRSVDATAPQPSEPSPDRSTQSPLPQVDSGDSLMQPELDLLNTAVSYAICRKGLGVLVKSTPEQEL